MHALGATRRHQHARCQGMLCYNLAHRCLLVAFTTAFAIRHCRATLHPGARVALGNRRGPGGLPASAAGRPRPPHYTLCTWHSVVCRAASESEPPMRRSAGPTRTSIMRSRTPTRRSQARRSHAHVLALERPSDSHGGAAACTQSTEDKIALRSLLLKSPPFRSFAFPECEDR